MADRYPVSEKVQIGVESTAGTAVAPTRELQGLNIELDTALEYDTFGPMGMIPNTLVAPRQEWGTGALSGYPTYTELPYVFSNVFGAATISTPTGATLARQWLWAPDESTPWTPKTWTIRRGVPGGTAEQADYGLLTGVNMAFSRTATPEIGGDLMTRRLDYTASLASTGVTGLTLVPVLPAEGDVWMDSTAAGLGVTKLLRDFAFSFTIADLFGPIWPINSSLNSFAAHGVSKPGTLEASLRLGNDSVGTSLVTNMRAGSSVFVRYKATSGTMIEASTPYSLQIDMALKCKGAPSRGDEDGLLSTLEWTFENVYDSTWDAYLKITMITSLTGL